MQHKRNEPCPCGSGKKYKVCCANKRTPSQWLALASVVIFAGLAAWVVAGVFRQKAEMDPSAPSGRVWSEEHRHWHDTGTSGSGPQQGPTPPGKEWSYEHGHWHDAAVPGLGRPAGSAPPGKVWNQEHGHWHDAVPGLGGPADPTPPGKVWNEEHGHWHDADSAEPAEEPEEAWTELPEDDVSYSEEEP